MNNTLNNSLEPNFNLAANLCEQNLDYETLMEFLKTGNILEKQLAALEINQIKTQKDAEILVSNLTGQDGKVREAVAFKINQFIQNKEFSVFFNHENIFSTLFEGLLDINGNVCRKICDICTINIYFRKYLAQRLPAEINIILDKIKKMSANEKQYKVSKRNFQLYWCLEALFYCLEEIKLSEINQILLQTCEFEDYTIREKTAKILAQVDNAEFVELTEKLKFDENYYVKRYLENI